MEVKRPILIAGAGVMLLSATLKMGLTLFLCLSAILVVLSLALSFLMKQRLHFIFVAFVFMLFSLVGTVSHKNAAVIQNRAGETANVKVLITQISKLEGRYAYFATGKIESINGEKQHGAKISLYLYNNQEVERGDRVTVRTTLDTDNVNDHMFSQNIFLQGYDVEILSRTQNANFLETAMGKLQNLVKEKVLKNLSGRAAQFILAVIIGDTGGIDDQTYANMKASGILHLVVVSGTHFTTVCAAVMAFAKRLCPRRKAKGVITLLLIAFIMLFCGFSMPVVRSGIAYFILTLGIFINREGDSLCALAATTVIILFLCPFGFYSVSLLLTLAATFGILVVTPIINKVTKIEKLRNKPLLFDLLNLITVTVSANMTTLPILMYTYDSVCLVSLITNLLINYAVSAVLVLALVAVVSPLSFVTKPLIMLSGLLSNYSLKVIDFCANIPLANVRVDGKRFAAVTVIIYLIITAVYLVLKKRSVKN